MNFIFSMEGLVPYEPPVSLWQLVEKHVPPNEWEEVKKILGESLVDLSMELHTEIETLLEIWKEYREETQQQITCQRLPEPPAARDRLKQEILFFVENLRQKASDSGQNPDHILKKHDSRVVNYVLSDSRPASQMSCRPGSAQSSRDGRETPLTPRPSSRQQVNAAQNLQQDLKERGEMLTSLNMDDVVSHLRETLEEEIKMLHQDIEFLQHCLDDEADFRSQSNFGGEPSLQDLRQSRSKLEKDLLSSDPAFPPSIKEPLSKTVQSIKLKPANALSHPNQLLHGNKPPPLKASHQIDVVPDSKPTDLAHQKDIEGFAQLKIRSRPVKGPSETTHMTVRARTLSDKPRLAESGKNPAVAFVPSPPSSAKSRPNSASRFRKMVLQCRDGPS